MKTFYRDYGFNYRAIEGFEINGFIYLVDLFSVNLIVKKHNQSLFDLVNRFVVLVYLVPLCVVKRFVVYLLGISCTQIINSIYLPLYTRKLLRRT